MRARLFQLWRRGRAVPACSYGKDPAVPLAKRIEAFGQRGGDGGILYLGDSTLLRHATEDRSLEGIDGFLQALCGRPVYPIAGSAYGPELFFWIVKRITEGGWRPGLCILPINMRSFSPLWVLNPKFRHSGLIREVSHGLEPLPDISEEEFTRTSVSVEGLGTRTVGEYRLLTASQPHAADMVRLRSALLFRYHYLFELAPGSQRVRRLDDTLALLTASGVPCLTYFTPLNMEAGEDLVGSEFEQGVRARVLQIRRDLVHAALPAVVCDWTFRCGRDCYFSPNIANEHLNERGRRRVADLLAREIDLMAKVA